MNDDKQKVGDLRVWWIPQVPMNPFHVSVKNTDEAKKILAVLADYDIFQLENKIKPDYCNAGGLEIFSQYGDGEWGEWESIDGETIDEVKP